MTVIGITGHQHIPDKAVRFVQSGIEAVLHDVDGRVTGVSCLAAGADQIFARAVFKIGGELHVVIPCRDYEKTFTDPEDAESFRHLIQNATSTTRLNHEKPSEEAFLDAGRTVVQLSQVLVAVWDGKKARGLGGTADIVRYARLRGLAVKIVWPAGTSR